MIYTVINNNIKFNIGKTTKQNIPKNSSFFPKIFLNSNKRYLVSFFIYFCILCFYYKIHKIKVGLKNIYS